METYSLLREFADSWMMLALFVFFIGVVFWAFRPGSRSVHEHVAQSIFRNDKKPAGAVEARADRAPMRPPVKEA